MNDHAQKAKRERIRRAKRLHKLYTSDKKATYRSIAEREGISATRVHALIKSVSGK